MRSPELATPRGWSCPAELSSCFAIFSGYLLLDALVGNQDRHHENWGLILATEGLSLAPTFDHASCLGRNETDDNRRDRLTTRDRGRTVAAYASRARSALYGSGNDKKPLGTVAAFAEAREIDPLAGDFWLSSLEVVKLDQLRQCLDRLPTQAASENAREFAFEMLKANRQRLLSLSEETR